MEDAEEEKSASVATSSIDKMSSMTELYEGVSQGFVKCLVCANESIR